MKQKLWIEEAPASWGSDYDAYIRDGDIVERYRLYSLTRKKAIMIRKLVRKGILEGAKRIIRANGPTFIGLYQRTKNDLYPIDGDVGRLL
jgi:hypothetical protein